MIYRFVRQQRSRFKIRRMCQVLGVSRSGYYAWCGRPVSKRTQANRRLLLQIERIHHTVDANYGSPRMWNELSALGIPCSVNRVARVMRQAGIRSKRGRRFRRPWLKSVASFTVPNILQGSFQTQRPNQVWLSDITYIPTDEGWLLLAAVMDLYSRRIIGWCMSKRRTHDVSLQALQMALASRSPIPGGLIHHSDRGIHYTNNAYQNLLSKHRIRVSMSRKGNCFDNAPMESFFATLKTELVYQRKFHRRTEAKIDLFEFIEAIYNRRRRHSSLGSLSPDEFEKMMNVSSRSVH